MSSARVLVLATFLLTTLSLTCVGGAQAQDEQNLASTGWMVTKHITGSYSGSQTEFTLTNGDGVFYGQCISVEMTSNVDYSLTITYDSGQVLRADDSEVQDMIVTGDYTWTLDAMQTKTVTISAFCMEMHDYAPGKDWTFSVTDRQGSTELNYICDRIQAGSCSYVVGQCSIWYITDWASKEELVDMGATEYQLEQAASVLESAGTTPPDDWKPSDDEALPSSLLYIGAVAAIVIILVVAVFAFAHSRKGKNPIVGASRKVLVEPTAFQTPPSSKSACRACGEVLDPAWIVCPSCGTNQDRRCPECGGMLEQGFIVCPNCGRRVKDN